MQGMYGADTDVKLVPSYFPFVEPGLEIYAKIKDRWVEMGGAGMIHPGVIKTMGLDPKEYQGFAFGLGLDRLVMLQYGIEDIRLFYGGNLRFLNQFKRPGVSPDPVLVKKPKQTKGLKRQIVPPAQPVEPADEFWDGAE